MRKSVGWKCKAGNNPYAGTYTPCLKGIGGVSLSFFPAFVFQLLP
mgnify:CR=1 FL=1